jgi:hypothetical protein
MMVRRLHEILCGGLVLQHMSLSSGRKVVLWR